jgi:hypothetical protein
LIANVDLAQCYRKMIYSGKQSEWAYETLMEMDIDHDDLMQHVPIVDTLLPICICLHQFESYGILSRDWKVIQPNSIDLCNLHIIILFF